MKSEKVLIVDCQVLQTTALHRGMGKYTLALLGEYKEKKLPYKQVVIILNESEQSASDEKVLRLSLKEFTVVRLPLQKTDPTKPELYNIVAKSNRKIIDTYVENNFKKSKIDFLITSLFHEDGCSVFPTHAMNRFLLIYDLIPLQFPAYYLDDPRGKTQYLSRFRELFKATHYFTISETVANDLALNIGVPSDRITAINGSYVSRKNIKQVVPKDFAPGDKFILMPTGDDVRKNNLRAVMAFEDFNSKSGYQYKLVLTSFFGDKTKKELLVQSDHVVFTGNISDEELAWLYSNADLVFFPSEYEGLGMPPLEAVELDKSVLCSNITVFKEITESAFHFCDPYSIPNMSEQLQKLLINADLKVTRKEYDRILKKYQWSNTADAMIAVFHDQSNIMPDVNKKKRIAVFAPTPSGYSAIGKVVQEQHYELSQYADVDYFLEEGITQRAKAANVRVEYLSYIADVSNPWSFDKQDAQKYDQIIYHIGNSEYHVVTAVKALAFPGTVILHDTNISGMLEIVKSLGYITENRYTVEDSLQKKIFAEKNIKQSEQKSSYISSLVNTSKNVITHSSYAHEAVNQVRINEETMNIRAELPTPAPFTVHGYGGVNRDRFVISFAGVIHPAKGLKVVTDIAQTIYSKPVHIKLFGFSLIDETIKKELLRNDNVEIIQNPSDTRFAYELRESDLIIGFRPDYHGETSLSALEALRLGRCVVVNDIGWFREIPDELVYKVKNLSDVKDVVMMAIKNEEAYKFSQQRLEYVRRTHSIAQYINLLLEG